MSESTTWRGDPGGLGLDLKRLAVSFARAQPGQLSLAFWETFDCVTLDSGSFAQCPYLAWFMSHFEASGCSRSLASVNIATIVDWSAVA